MESNGELGKGTDRLNIFVMPGQRKPGYISPRKRNRPGNIPEHSNLAVCTSPSYLSGVVCKWLQFWRLRDLPVGHSGPAGLAFTDQYRYSPFVYEF